MEKQDIIHVFQHEFGRLLTPMEKEIIADWKKDGFDEETIIKAAYAYEQETNFRAKYKPTFKGGAQ